MNFCMYAYKAAQYHEVSDTEPITRNQNANDLFTLYYSPPVHSLMRTKKIMTRDAIPRRNRRDHGTGKEGAESYLVALRVNKIR